VWGDGSSANHSDGDARTRLLPSALGRQVSGFRGGAVWSR
jgi:hypothetical protein